MPSMGSDLKVALLIDGFSRDELRAVLEILKSDIENKMEAISEIRYRIDKTRSRGAN